MDDRTLLDEQIRYYRDRAPEYDEWFLRQGRYDRGDAHRGRWAAEVATVREALHREPLRGKVLELACGTGLWTAELARHDVAITAVDSSPEVLSLNRRKLNNPSIQYLEADLFGWRAPGMFDMIMFGFWLTHVPPARFDAFWDMVEAGLAPGGRVFLVDNKWYPGYTWQRPGPASGPEQTELPEWSARRELKNGREYDIVKVLYDVEDLYMRLRARGWHGTVAETPEFFIWADVRFGVPRAR